MGTRRKARECALQLLFQWEGERGAPADTQARFWRQRPPPNESTRAFADRLFTATVAGLEEIDSRLAAHSQHWRLERMTAVDRNILRLAVCELEAEPATPPAVVINEALEIARRFSTPESVEFINGILDAIRKTLEAGAEAKP
ncbi:MAG: transcription antitermination factor NusB [Terriglobia bacterium]